jgi:hypothetical protein
VRALSTVLLTLALATPAGAQIFGAPRGYIGPGWWFGVEGGNARALTMSDKASSANWILEKSTPYRVTLDYGPRERTFGLALAQGTSDMRYEGADCAQCLGQVTMQQALLRTHIMSPLFTTGLYAVTDISVGMTRWSDLKGREGSVIAPISANNDFTYGISLGAVLPLGERLDLSVSMDALSMKHEPRTLTTGGTAGSGNVSMSTLRFGGRIRLGK